MTYRSLHILLIVLLLALDVVMINLAGVGAFWLRCRTGLFEEVDARSSDLTRQSVLLWGIGNSGRYRSGNATGDASDWMSFNEGALTTPVSEDVGSIPVSWIEVDLGGQCRVDEIHLATENVDPSLVRFSPPAGAKVSYGVGALKVVPEDEQVSDFRLDIGSLSHVSALRILGSNPKMPRILSPPAIRVPQRPYEYLLVVWNAAALFGLLFAGAYRLTRSLELLDDLLLVVKATATAMVVVIVILFLHRGYQEFTYTGFEFSRLVVIFGSIFSVFLLTANRAIVDVIHTQFLKHGVGIRKVLVVGAGPVGQRIVERLRKHYWLAYEPIGFVDDTAGLQGQTFQGLTVLGGTNRLPELAEAAGTRDVIVALPNSSHKTIRDIVGRCQQVNLRFHILPDLFEVISSDVRIGAIDGVPILDLDDHYLGEWDRFLKRGLDVTAVLVGGVLISPALAIFALLIKLSSQGPILYTQARVGEHGKSFECYKFRTMWVVSREEEKKEREQAYQELVEGRTSGKIVNENRVTAVGRFLRKFRLDELPQLLNVLKGDMSIVGPRPPIPYEVENYNSWHMERFKGKPGITGLWQVSGGSDLSFEEMVRLDIFYLKSWSLWLDLKIVLRTVPVVLGGRGA